jgi:hypothetical protein
MTTTALLFFVARFQLLTNSFTVTDDNTFSQIDDS